MAMHTEMWFPSVVWSALIHWADNQAIQKFARDKRAVDAGRVISNVGGWQSSDLRQGEHPAIDKFIDNLNKEVSWCCKQTGLPELEIYNLWININPPNSYNELHDHAGSVLSGVYYVDADPSQGNLQIERSDNAEYFLPLNPESITYFTATRNTYAAKTGALYIFPSWLKHSVQINRSDSDRISLSFNYGVKN